MPDGSQIDRGGSAMLLTLPNVITFARLCASLTDADPKAARAWLRRHGGSLHAYG